MRIAIEASPTERRRIRPLSQRQLFSALGPSQTTELTEGFVENEESKESEEGAEGEEDEMDIDSPLQPDIDLGGADEEQAVSTSEPGKLRNYSFQASLSLASLTVPSESGEGSIAEADRQQAIRHLLKALTPRSSMEQDENEQDENEQDENEQDENEQDENEQDEKRAR